MTYTKLMVLFFSLYLLANAQWKFILNTSNNYDGNILRTYKPIEDLSVSPSLDVQYISEKYEISYSGSFFFLMTENQYNNQNHGIYLDVFQEKSVSTTFNYGANFLTRIDQSEYDYYDYSRFQGYFAIKAFPFPWMMISSEISSYYKYFSKEKLWNHWETSLFSRASIFLPTKTTLRFEMNYLIRDFQPYTLVVNEDNPDEMMHSGMRGRGMISSTWLREELPTLWQLIVSGRIAQSLLPRVGGYLDYQYRYNPTAGNPYELEIEGFSPIDDYFGYSGQNVTLSLKYKMSPSATIKITSLFYSRKYLNRPVYKYDFENNLWIVEDDHFIILEDNRKDVGYRVDLSAKFSIQNLILQPTQMNLELFGSYQENDSNDPYFVFNNIIIGINIGYGIQF